MKASVGPEFFDAVFARDLDPWGFYTSAYERAKYLDTLNSLPHGRYRSGLEIGCATAVLGGLIAERCDRYLGVDFSEVALTDARRRHADRAEMDFVRLRFPAESPDGVFDLIVLSEILYFMNEQDVSETARAVCRLAAPDAIVLLVHWLGQSGDHVLSGDCAVDVFGSAAAACMSPLKALRRDGYRLDVLVVGRESSADQPTAR